MPTCMLTLWCLLRTRAGPPDDDKDVLLAVTSDEDSDEDDLAAADNDHAGAGAGSIVLSGQVREFVRVVVLVEGKGPRSWLGLG